jgi:phospholipase A1
MKVFLLACLLVLPGAAGAASLLDERQQEEDSSPFPLVPFRPNYLLPWTYNSHPNEGSFQKSAQNSDKHLQRVEAKFQLSIKLPLWRDAFGVEKLDLNAAYTQLCFWQVYNGSASAPFRDSNYEPELHVSKTVDYDVLGLRLRRLKMGFVHQSNGRGAEVISRSWNRIYWEAVLERGPFQLQFKPWWRIPDAIDSNPGISNYYGYGEARGVLKWRENVFSVLWRNNLQFNPQNRGAVELGWSYPLARKWRWYVQYFNGFGESLVDYNHANERIGAGVMLGEWL